MLNSLVRNARDKRKHFLGLELLAKMTQAGKVLKIHK